MVGTIWLGFDKRIGIVPGGKAGELAAPIWGRIMARLGERSRDWPRPAGVESRLMDDHGNVYATHCHGTATLQLEYFIEGTAPEATCAGGTRPVPPKKKAWLRRLWRR
jgi:membrane carboxypeptidase/penicillin-binding protein